MNRTPGSTRQNLGYGRRTIAGLVFLIVGPMAGGTADDPGPPADHAWAAIEECVRTMDQKGASQDAYRQFVQTARLRDELHERLLRFLRDHPQDRRCAEATFHLLMRPPAFLTKVDPARFATEGTAAAVYREDARQEWERQAQRIREAFLQSPATREEWRQDLARRDLYLEGRDAVERLQAGAKVDLGPLRARLDEWLRRNPESDRVAAPVESYMRALALAQPDVMEAEWERFAQSSNPALQELAQGQALVLRSQQHPIDWKFTALDGREVDLARLRGKVVLVDFWATWCAPCIAEMPQLQALYAQYHDQGLEIIGVSLDSAGDRAKLEKFIVSRAIPWPQHFDGGGRRNAYAVRYGIKSIPTKILLDREGRVAVPRIGSEQLAATLAKMFPP